MASLTVVAISFHRFTTERNCFLVGTDHCFVAFELSWRQTRLQLAGRISDGQVTMSGVDALIFGVTGKDADVLILESLNIISSVTINFFIYGSSLR